MLLFWKLVDETQKSTPAEPTKHHNSIKLWMLLPFKADFFATLLYEIPCRTKKLSKKLIFIKKKSIKKFQQKNCQTNIKKFIKNNIKKQYQKICQKVTSKKQLQKTTQKKTMSKGSKQIWINRVIDCIISKSCQTTIYLSNQIKTMIFINWESVDNTTISGQQ